MIATVDELVDFMSNITLDRDQRDAAEIILEGAQSEVETYLNRPIERVIRVEVLHADAAGYVWPFATPIASVASLTYVGTGGLAVPLNGTEIIDGGIYVGVGLNAYGPLTLTYVGGMNPVGVPAAKLVVLRIAAREMQNRHDDTLSVRDLNTEPAPLVPEGLQPEDEKRLERWRRRTVVSG